MDSSSSAATAKLLSGIESGEFNCGIAKGLEREGADLTQGLAYAIGLRRVAAVLVLVHDCGVRLGSDGGGSAGGATVPPPSNEQLWKMASEGDWATVAYYAAADRDGLLPRLRAVDEAARGRLRQLAGGVRVRLPRDVREAYARTGKLKAELLVERRRWLLPRPRREESFAAVDGTKLEDGWYTVTHYPLSDELDEAVLRRTSWSAGQRPAAAELLKTAGETLLCKAVKAEQWEFVDWALEHGDAAELARQVDNEFLDAWGATERRATLCDHDELVALDARLGPDGALTRRWRHGPLAVPAGATLRSPRLDTLREAVALGALSLYALQRVGASVLTFLVPQASAAKESWRADLAAAAAAGACGFPLPLLHCMVLADRAVERLLEAMVSVDACDSNGLTALAAAASKRRWGAMELLLDEGGCCVDGRSGTAAMVAVQRASKEQADDAEQAAALLDKLHERQQRPPAATLADYFWRLAKGEIVQGIQPRRFEPHDDELHLRRGHLRVSTKVMVAGIFSGDHRVLFLRLPPDRYAEAVAAGVLDLHGKQVLDEEELLAPAAAATAAEALAVPVALPPAYVRAGARAGVHLVQPSEGGALARGMPVLARSLPPGGLRVSSATACCGVAIGRVEVLVDGVRVGETPPPSPLEEGVAAVRLLVPPRELDVRLEMSGQHLRSERVAGGPDAAMHATVPLVVFLYIQVVDEEENIEFVYVAGHRRDVPEESRAFVGEATWDAGHARLSALAPLPLGDAACLLHLKSLALVPELPPGRRFEPNEWEDTGACQFQRMLGVPVKVGKIYTG